MRRVVWLMVMALLLASVSVQAGDVREHPVFDTPLTDAPGEHMTVTTVTYAPGAKSAPHYHNRAVFVYVLAGVVRSQIAGQPVRLYHAGDSWFESPGDHHVICENASATRSAKFLVVYVGIARGHAVHTNNVNT